MKRCNLILIACILWTSLDTLQAQDSLLTGAVMGSSPSLDYTTNQSTTTINLPSAAFDGDLNTFYASYSSSYTWVGMDLGSKHVVTRIGWCPRNEATGSDEMMLGVFEGANRADFMDAVPLYMIDHETTTGQMNYHNVSCSAGFRYVRYLGPSGYHCQIAELQFYGHAGEGDNTNLYRPTNLPCIVIHTKNNQEPWNKADYIESYVTLIGDDGSVLQDTAGLRLRGNSSLEFPKRPYRLKFAHKHKVLGSPANAKNWALINNYSDKSLMRNILAFHISEVFGMPYTPFCKAVDLFFNGEYKGCYQLADKIEVKKGRVNIQEMDSTDISGEALSGGYLWEMNDQGLYENNWIRSSRDVWVVLHYPDPDEMVPEQKAYIRNFYQEMENAAYAASSSDTTWRQYIDYSTFARHFLINQLCGNIDIYWSMYMYKQRGDPKAYSGPVWDFDLAFDNDYRVYPTSQSTDYLYGSGRLTAEMAKHILFADAQTRSETAEHWRLARTHGINTEELSAFIDSIALLLEQSQQLNFTRWPVMSQKIHMNPLIVGSYSAEIEWLKDFLTTRIAWLDNKLGYIPASDTPTHHEQIADDNQRYDIYDVQGRHIYTGQTFPSLPTGFYIIRHNRQTSKLVIQ